MLEQMRRDLIVNPSTAAIRIVIADDHGLVREGIKALLQLEAGVVVLAAVDNADDLSAQLVSAPCDVILLDRGLQGDGRADVRSSVRAPAFSSCATASTTTAMP